MIEYLERHEPVLRNIFRTLVILFLLIIAAQLGDLDGLLVTVDNSSYSAVPVRIIER